VWASIRPGSRIEKGSKEKEQQGLYMMFLVLPSHSAQTFPFL